MLELEQNIKKGSTVKIKKRLEKFLDDWEKDKIGIGGVKKPCPMCGHDHTVDELEESRPGFVEAILKLFEK